MAVDQRNSGNSQSIAPGIVYTVDRWICGVEGGTVTGQRVQGATVGQFRYQFTGASSVTRIGFGQRIEQLNSADLAGTTVTLSLDLANSLLTTVTWTASYANTADNFSALTTIATGTFTVSGTLTRYSTNINIPVAATTGIQIYLTVDNQTSGTWTIGNVQLETGIIATPFERRSYGQELALCQRYYEQSFEGANPAVIGGMIQNFNSNGSINTAALQVVFKITKRASPTVTSYSPSSGASGFIRDGSGADRTATVQYVNSFGAHITNSAIGNLANYSAQWTASAEL